MAGGGLVYLMCESDSGIRELALGRAGHPSLARAELRIPASASIEARRQGQGRARLAEDCILAATVTSMFGSDIISS